MIDLQLEGKIAIVTGASRGLGRATAIALHQQGSRILAVARTLEDLETLAAIDPDNLQHSSMAKLAASEGLDARFVEHIWAVLNEPSSSFPTSAIVKAWRTLPVPNGNDMAFAKKVRSQCDGIYALLSNWQSMLAATSGDEEEAAVLTEGEIHVSPKHSFKADLKWPKDSTTAAAKLSVTSASQNTAASKQTASGLFVIWRNPHVRFRREDQRWTSKRPLKDLLTEESVRRYLAANL